MSVKVIGFDDNDLQVPLQPAGFHPVCPSENQIPAVFILTTGMVFIDDKSSEKSQCLSEYSDTGLTDDQWQPDPIGRQDGERVG
jgi:hypothetical protein